jgi:hypothetical protein
MKQSIGTFMLIKRMEGNYIPTSGIKTKNITVEVKIIKPEELS